MPKRSSARQVAQDRGSGEWWIDHAAVTAADADWLGAARWLTLWNVSVPPGFLASLPHLEGVDVRGGSATDLTVVAGCERLRALVVNQVRGLADLSMVPSLASLELLHLYGLKQVTAPPSLAPLAALRRLEVGVMRGLPALGPLLDAPCVEELLLIRWVNVTADDVVRIKAHPALARFHWFAEDVPDSRWVPVVDGIGLPPPPVMRPKAWLDAHS